VVELMALSRSTPTVVVERRMSLAALVAARRTWPNRPAWSTIFVKAYATVAARWPVLRQSYMSFPWGRLYEHPISVASVAVERTVDGEDVIFFAQVRSPEEKSLAELEAFLRQCKEAPLETIGPFRRELRLARTPWPLRPLVWWVASNFSGKQRAQMLGTFGLTSLGSLGAGVLRVISPLTTNLHFGIMDERGDLDVRLSIDHRVLDGATAARALIELEEVLVSEILEELRSPPLGLAG
jgi:hypothetical protein